MTTSHPSVLDTSLALPSGRRMPLLGFGTWQIKGDQATAAVAAALDAGYRHLDTATVYRNEGEVGAALRDSGVPREEVFVTTKCPGRDPGSARDTLEQSLELLGTDHVDLWLVHWPEESVSQVDVWAAFVQAREDGLATDIGVSNFDLQLVDEVTSASGVAPAVNQIEWSPLLFDAGVLAGHQERAVVLEGYSALRGGTLEHPVITEIADRFDRTAAQVIVRWHLQHETDHCNGTVFGDRLNRRARKKLHKEHESAAAEYPADWPAGVHAAE
jgi:diketogulonate reductase-like aldo/keto reductase